ncbi:MAG: helix-turn-helix transcriptional regulator [Mogibacterium sp.]|nr:helix-turn-helix transcriptional regulator [Mogibacterium sp.]
MTIGNRIKQIRENTLRISQTELAEKIGVSKQTLYKYENDIITNIPSDKIEAIARLAGLSPSYLMGWDDPEPTPAAEAGTVLGKAARDPNQIKLLGNYQQLNDEGQKEILNHMDYVISQEKYKNL